MKSVFKKFVSLVLAIGMTASMAVAAQAAPASSTSGIDPEEFQNPGIEYRPRVRWWLPGGAVEGKEMVRELQALYDNGFGGVEINSFGKYVNADSYYALDSDPAERFLTKEYYDAIDMAVEKASELGMTFDMNMGSGWNANDSRLDPEDGMKTMVIGRDKVTVTSTAPLTTDVPVPLKSPNLGTANLQWPVEADGTYDPKLVHIHSITVAPIISSAGSTSVPQLSNDPLGRSQYVVDMEKAQSFDMSDADNKKSFTWTPAEVGEYLVSAIYSVATSEAPHNDSLNAPGSENKKESITVDHLDPAAIENYMNLWLGDPEINDTIKKYGDTGNPGKGTIQAYFNDSYEFRTDTYYNDLLYENAKNPNNTLGYDFSKYLPLVYATGASRGAGSGGLIVASTATDINNRIKYDFNQLQNEQMLEGMRAFSELSKKYGAVYRQEPYNPPFLDSIGSGKYVDIPEAEQENEDNLRRAGSSAHLYGRPVATAEQYTLGNTPYSILLEKVKGGINLMATSGINNFQYHGFSYRYMGNEALEKDYYYGESGYNAFYDIGIDVNEASAMWPYYKDINLYAARTQYLMQSGVPSADAALYVPNSVNATNSFNSRSGAAKALNDNGYSWDAINNESILNSRYEDGRIRMGFSDIHFGAIIVQSDTVPLDVMQKLKELANEGAAIIFFGIKPGKQPSYLDGKYAEGDALVQALAEEILEAPNTGSATESDLVSKLGFKGAISYEYNTGVRFIRRTLESGGELAFFRNTTGSNNTITIRVNDSNLVNHYLVDQNTGDIYPVEAVNGKIAITLNGGTITDRSSVLMGGAITILSEPAGVEIDSKYLTGGEPDLMRWLAMEKGEATQELTTFDLTVTADNLGGSGDDLSKNGYLKNAYSGETDTKTFTDIELGNWRGASSGSSYLNGALKFLGSAAAYTTTFQITGGVPDSYFLNLGTVHSIAEVTVNGITFDPLIANPYVLDIGSALKSGENALEIKVTPRSRNRYTGFRKAYDELNTAGDPGKNVYQYYASRIGASSDAYNNLVDAGLVGPVTLTAASNTILSLTTNAHNVNAGDYFTANTRFKETQNSNTVVLKYTFDGDKFEYANFTPANGVSVIDTQYGNGFAKIAVMIPNYKASNLGDIMLRAKENAELINEWQSISVDADYVLRDDVGDKTINTSTAYTSFTTVGDGTGEPIVPGDTNNDRIVDIIDLSNMIDWFGIDNSNTEWAAKYTFFDYNNNGQIDINDISYVARLIA